MDTSEKGPCLCWMCIEQWHFSGTLDIHQSPIQLGRTEVMSKYSTVLKIHINNLYPYIYTHIAYTFFAMSTENGLVLITILDTYVMPAVQFRLTYHKKYCYYTIDILHKQNISFFLFLSMLSSELFPYLINMSVLCCVSVSRSCFIKQRQHCSKWKKDNLIKPYKARLN